ncbi:Cytochrome P450 82A1 [Talaromyces islandicus]|uniref:Cytochrome P450 82A1 n=1 Tax=Talaromyces islandicus TaxID=28573 RepID=A0A0U1M8E3_TALIS|nr:Cytochrome P450 82A1 [Talaromyces islandicus]
MYSKSAILKGTVTDSVQSKVKQFLDLVESDPQIASNLVKSLHFFSLDNVTWLVFGDRGTTKALMGNSSDRQILSDIDEPTARRYSWFQVHLPRYTRWVMSCCSHLRSVIDVFGLLPGKTPLSYSGLQDFALATFNIHRQDKTLVPASESSLMMRLMHAQNGDSGEASLSNMEVAAECADNLDAGLKTTSDTLMFALWVLSLPKHRQYQERLIAEVRDAESAFTDTASILSLLPVDVCDKLPFLDAIIKETLRLYAPIPASQPRTSSRDTTIDGFHIPADTVVSCQAFSLHRNAEVFPNPNIFDPDRWLASDAETAEMKRWWWPFSSGARMCLRMHFALAEIKTLLAAIYQTYSTTLSPEFETLSPTATSRFELVYDESFPIDQFEPKFRNRIGLVCQQCQLEPRFKFRPVRHVYQQIDNIQARFDLVWDDQQVWVGVSQPVTFVSETDDSTHEPPESEDKYQEPELSYPSPNDSQPAAPNAIESIPTDILLDNTPSPGPVDVSTLSMREAFLIRSYIQKIAAVADICDSQSHFSTEVPRRALEEPMLLKALLALAARHDAILTNRSDCEASAFHGECLELLIPALNQPQENYDENLLITVVVLRFYEELERITDRKCHLLGSNRLLNLMSRSASSGGLAEAVSWQFLRQAIYSSIVQSEPMQLDMRNYERSSVFHRDDDAAHANSIIFLCACIIQQCCNAPGYVIDRKSWQRLADYVEEWYRNKPRTWQPLRYEAPDLSADRPFPELWIMSPPAVVGLQYYHASKIFLTLSDAPSLQMSDYEMSRARLVAEKNIASHVVTAIGLSLSNENVQNSYFIASHLLQRFGYCLRQPAEQQGALQFLSRVEANLGWRTSWIGQELENQWMELAAFSSNGD